VSPKIIAVVGATGSQGGGLARAILADPDGGFAVRAITRDASSEKARALADLGAEVVEADIDNEADLDAVFAGAYGAYCVTFFWAHFSPDKEQVEARAMARAAKKADLKHVIWSTLEDTRRFIPIENDRMPTLQGRFNVPHFDSKGEVNHVFTDAGVPVTFLQTSFYWDNFILFGMGPKRQDGTLVLTLPMGDKKLPGIVAEDIGRCAYALFQRPESIGTTVSIAGEHLTGVQMAGAFSRALGEDVAYNAVSPDVYRSFGFPGADDLGNMFQFKQEFEAEYCGARDLTVARSLNPSMQTLDEWLAQNAGELVLE
jgi:uncharacterized protein YbjT (DUF2867 family)